METACNYELPLEHLHRLSVSTKNILRTCTYMYLILEQFSYTSSKNDKQKPSIPSAVHILKEYSISVFLKHA